MDRTFTVIRIYILLNLNRVFSRDFVFERLFHLRERCLTREERKSSNKIRQSKFPSLEFNIFRKMKNIIAPFIALCRPRDYDRVKTEFIKKQEK